jgi:hypothetical protein
VYRYQLYIYFKTYNSNKANIGLYNYWMHSTFSTFISWSWNIIFKSPEFDHLKKKNIETNKSINKHINTYYTKWFHKWIFCDDSEIALDLLAICLISFGENSIKHFTFFAANLRLLYFEKYSFFYEFKFSVSESSIACLSFCFALIKSSIKCLHILVK